MNAAGELTLNDLLIALGERVGQFDRGQGADNRVSAASDPQTRDRLLRAINAGRREVYSRMPDARCFQPRLSITLDPTGTSASVVDGDTSKYRLPYSVQGMAGGQWNWSMPGTGGFGGDVPIIHPSDIERLHFTTNSQSLTRWPGCAAFLRMPLGNPNEPGRRFCHVLWVYPKPDIAYLVQGQARVMYEPLVSLDDLEPMGQQHAETILAFAERDWELGRRETADQVAIDARCDKAIAISIELDNTTGPQSIGPAIDPESIRDSLRYTGRRGYYPERGAMVDTVSGVPVL